MRRIIHRENVKHFHQLLEQTAGEAKRRQILKLLAEEEAKEHEIDADDGSQ